MYNNTLGMFLQSQIAPVNVCLQTDWCDNMQWNYCRPRNGVILLAQLKQITLIYNNFLAEW